jgi:DNA polymerase I-like protein with 3'-5' exonuclease and polymerase domains
MEDDVLAKFEGKHYIIKSIRELHTLHKDVGTYGRQWATQWVTKPSGDEGWLHPMDGKIHSTLNPYDAETGRTTSEKPNEQNLPQDKEVRQSFIADPDDESIRISKCCDADTTYESYYDEAFAYRCVTCGVGCETRAEDYSLITCDMSGAELRIIAELSGDLIWIAAFDKGQDVHSVGTEILYPEKWPMLALPDCAYYKKDANGEPERLKCKCPEHEALRNSTKAVNFLLAYGGGPHTLAARIGVSVGDAVDIMALHERKFPTVWAYLYKSGTDAKKLKKSFDMYGRRRIYVNPDRILAAKYIKKDATDSKKFALDLTKEEKKSILAQWKFENNATEVPDEIEWDLLHTQPTPKDLDAKIMRMISSIERQGKNMCIQGTNATIAKIALGQGYDIEGKPFLWHILPKYGAKYIKFVHDEIVIQCPTRYAKIVAGLIQDAFKRAAALKMKKVVMEADFKIAKYWNK